MLAHGKERVLVIPDMQAPFQHQDTLEFLTFIRDIIKPTKTVCIGDSLDLHFASQYANDPDGHGAIKEYELGMDFMREFYKEFPEGVEVDSNHNDRIHKAAFNAGLPSRFILDMKAIMQAPDGWEFKEYVEYDGVMYEHGHKLPGGMYGFKRAAVSLGKSVVMGHHHAHAGISFTATRFHTIFGMNCGCLIDKDAYAFKYAKGSLTQVTLCAGAVIHGTPQLFYMKTDKHDRWIGCL